MQDSVFWLREAQRQFVAGFKRANSSDCTCPLTCGCKSRIFILGTEAPLKENAEGIYAIFKPITARDFPLAWQPFSRNDLVSILACWETKNVDVLSREVLLFFKDDQKTVYFTRSFHFEQI